MHWPSNGDYPDESFEPLPPQTQALWNKYIKKPLSVIEFKHYLAAVLIEPNKQVSFKIYREINGLKRYYVYSIGRVLTDEIRDIFNLYDWELDKLGHGNIEHVFNTALEACEYLKSLQVEMYYLLFLDKAALEIKQCIAEIRSKNKH